MVGKTLKHYRIDEHLGQGGMGVVYRATDTRLGRPVALKVLHDRFTGDADRRARFLQEARAASAVNHPAIAQVYDADEDDGVTFIVLEFVEGATVRSLVEQKELDVLGAVEIALQLTSGLAKAHEAGIIHRDIKSENVMVTKDGHAKILDFGLAKLDRDSADGSDPMQTIQHTLAATQDGMVVGTIGYMSPEQARGRELDARSDIFSLGVVLYEMVTGEMPFRGDSPLDTLHAIAFEETRPVTTIRSNLPASLHRAVSRCLRKRPEDRYESAALLERDLRAVQRDIDSGITGGFTLPDRIRESIDSLRARPNFKWIAILAGVALFGLLVFLAGMLSDGDAIPVLVVFTLLGLMTYRNFRNRRYRAHRKFAKKVSKMDEVKLVKASEFEVTVVVQEPKAKTYVHLNSQMDRQNDKIYFGERSELKIVEMPPPAEFRVMLQSTGVLYVDDDVTA